MTASANLQGRSVLVVEDDYMVALDLAQSLEEAGAAVIGPAGTVADAIDLIANGAERIDGAVLDINLHGEHAYSVADALSAAGVPFVFLTGYDALAIPKAYQRVSFCGKPMDRMQLARTLSR